MRRRLKHWFRHEWADDGFVAYWGYRPRITTEVCQYPGCSVTSLLDNRDNIRFGVR